MRKDGRSYGEDDEPPPAWAQWLERQLKRSAVRHGLAFATFPTGALAWWILAGAPSLGWR
jgi:hypothetical protein